MSETVSFRIPAGVKAKLKEVALQNNHPSLTSLLRAIVLSASQPESEEESPAYGLLSQKAVVLSDRSCPLLSFARRQICTRCPYREQSVVSREQTPPDPPTSGDDEASKLIDDLFEEDKGET